MKLTFLSNIKQIISQNKYAFFVLSLIILIIIGSFFSGFLSSLFGGKKIEKAPSEKTVVVNDQNQQTTTSVSNKVIAEFNQKVPQISALIFGSEFTVKKEVSSSDLTNLNNRASVYSVIQHKPEDLLKGSGFKGLNFENGTIVKGKMDGNLDDFVSAYSRLLNASSSNSNYSFSIKKLTEKSIELIGDEYKAPEAFANAGTLYVQATYGIYLNGYLLADSYGQSSVMAIYNKYEKTVNFNILNFFPKTITLSGSRSFDAKEYTLTPKMALDSDLITQVIDRGLSLKSTDFTFDNSREPVLVYIFDPVTNYIVPQIAFTGATKDVQGVLNTGVMFLPK